jgi:hypothetical protein
MSEHRNPLTPSESLTITQSLTRLKERLNEAGELLAAMHIDHALQCLDPEDPISRQAADKS